MTRTLIKLVGAISIALGIIQCVRPHNVLPLSCGVLSLYFGTQASPPAARSFARWAGAFYLILGALGYALGQPGHFIFTDAGPDAHLLRLRPSLVELGTMDHNIHLLFGLGFWAAGFLAKTRGKPSLRGLPAAQAAVR